ncbi:hypothetical protein PR048_020392 [Dryococelus australis]|uniref:Prefoldin subunit 5 n=1 Tax=Dryococelus australis TaxID=614101 RepID=A0ABQ9H661_9NEOP|nr:hypothetical protein PR048_020392 [Dryococelus australis]
MASNGEMELLDITKLSLYQLTQLKQQFDRELNVFSDSLQTLKMAQGKFMDSNESLEKISRKVEGTTIMVPLTGSMYVPGRISDGNSVLIDIGTGYFVRKDVSGARDYFSRRVAYVTQQMEKISALALEKNKQREAVVDIMEAQIQAQLAGQTRQC